MEINQLNNLLNLANILLLMTHRIYNLIFVEILIFLLAGSILISDLASFLTSGSSLEVLTKVRVFSVFRQQAITLMKRTAIGYTFKTGN